MPNYSLETYKNMKKNLSLYHFWLLKYRPKTNNLKFEPFNLFYQLYLHNYKSYSINFLKTCSIDIELYSKQKSSQCS